jgi:hypothetical protein
VTRGPAWRHGVTRVGLRSQYDSLLNCSTTSFNTDARRRYNARLTVHHTGGALTFTSDSNHNDPPRCTATSCTSNTSSLAALQLLFDGVRSVLRSECAELYRLCTAVRSVYSCNLYTVLCAAGSCHQRTSAPRVGGGLCTSWLRACASVALARRCSVLVSGLIPVGLVLLLRTPCVPGSHSADNDCAQR